MTTNNNKITKNIAVNNIVEYGCYGNYVPAIPTDAKILSNGLVLITLECKDYGGSTCTEALPQWRVDLTSFGIKQ